MENKVSEKVEYDIKEILGRLDSRFESLETKLESRLEKLETKLDKVSEDVADVKTNLVRIEATFKGEIVGLSKDIQGINKRLDGQEFINRGVAIGLLVALLGGLAKLFGFSGAN